MNFPPKGVGGPPPGYDDSSIIPRERLKLITLEFEKEIRKIEEYFHLELPGEFRQDANLKLQLNSMIYAAKELGEDYFRYVEEINHAYHAFEANPSSQNIHKILSNINRLKALIFL